MIPRRQASRREAVDPTRDALDALPLHPTQPLAFAPSWGRPPRTPDPATHTDFVMTATDFAATTWVEPKLVAEVRYTEWTDEGLLRHPVFLRFRDDKKPEECIRQDPGGEAEPEGEAVPPGAPSSGRMTPDPRRNLLARLTTRDRPCHSRT